MDQLIHQLGLVPAINAAGPVTRLGGHRLSAEVSQAMAMATQVHLSIPELQSWANSRIVRATGAEAGIVTSGASAALLLAAAACIARLDARVMDRLPDTSDFAAEIVVHRVHRTAYDHALRAAGARFVEVGYAGYPGAGRTYAWELSAAVSNRTVAFMYALLDTDGTVSLAETAAIAHAHGLPVIVDAARAVPPSGNLRRFFREGADLVAFSGGKGLRGPQASGILAGRADLVASAALQQMDLDINQRTWALGSADFGSSTDHIPHNGVGRAAKVGKETIVALMVALDQFLARDDEVERARELEAVHKLASRLAQAPVSVWVRASEGYRYRPTLLLQLDGEAAADCAADVSMLLQSRRPPVFLGEGELDEGILKVSVATLDPKEAELLPDFLVAAIRGHLTKCPRHPAMRGQRPTVKQALQCDCGAGHGTT